MPWDWRPGDRELFRRWCWYLLQPWRWRLHSQVFLAMVLGITLGLSFGDPAVSALGWLGTVFVQALQMVIVPLVLTSLVSGVASIGTGRDLGRIGMKTLGYYMLSSFIAILIGLFFVNLIEPGVGADFAGVEVKEVPEIDKPEAPGDFILNLVLRFLPANPIQAMAEGAMLGVIGFSILLGLAIAHLPDDSRALARRGFDIGFEIMMKLTGGVIRFVPLGVLGLMTRAAGVGGWETFAVMAKYIVTVACGLLLHMFVALPLLLILVGRMNPVIHFRNVFDALVTAFSTSSSGATLPVTMRCLREDAGVSNRITSFVLPMGATVNMDGTALVECVAAIFIAQVLGFPLEFGQQLIIVVTAFAASVGTAAVPSAGLVMLFIVLEAIGLKTPEAITIVGIILAVDRPLDMFRTSVNVLSDSCGAAIIARSEGEKEVNAPRSPPQS